MLLHGAMMIISRIFTALRNKTCYNSACSSTELLTSCVTVGVCYNYAFILWLRAGGSGGVGVVCHRSRVPDTVPVGSQQHGNIICGL